MKLPPHPFIAKYQALPVPANVKAITNVWGSLSAKALILAEHPTVDEIDNNLAFTSVAARVYHRAMLADTGFTDLSEDFIVIPFSRFNVGRGSKPSKASTEHTFEFLKDAVPSLTNLRCTVRIGMTSFGFTFAGGRRTHARSIIGNPMFLPQLYTLPVVVLPDTSLVVPDDPDNWRAARLAKDKMVQIQNLTINLHAFVQSLKPKGKVTCNP